MNKRVLVFASSESGDHRAMGGMALQAYSKHGARHGMSYGHYGDSFAIPIQDKKGITLALDDLADYVRGFLAYASAQQQLTFQVTRIGYISEYPVWEREVAALFKFASFNCQFHEAWNPWLGDSFTYVGRLEP